MKLLAFAASHREESLNAKLLEVALGMVSDHDAMIDVTHLPYDAMDVPLFNHDDQDKNGFPDAVKSVKDHFSDADAIMIAMPEYNWSYPGSLKNIIDWLSCYRPTPLKGKPIFLMSATPSEQGGLIGLNALKAVLGGWVNMYVYPECFGLPLAHESLQDGVIQDDARATQLRQQLLGFMDYCTKLKA